MEDWQWQMQHQVNTLEALRSYIDVTPQEEEAILTMKTRWGTTPYFAGLMERTNPLCPVRQQVVPSLKEKENHYGMENYLVWKENRDTIEVRPDSIARQYRDRVAFTISDVCANYCRHCFRKELIVDRELTLNFDVEEGLEWIREHAEVRDVLITGGDPFLFSDDRIAYLVDSLRQIPHLEMIRFHTRVPVILPQRITPGLLKALSGFHRVPIWINIQTNHAREITEQTARAVFDLTTCGINVGNQGVLLKGINDDITSFRELHQKLLSIRVRPYYMFYCEPAPGIDHFRTPITKGAELIRDALQGHTSGLATPRYVVATNIGKIPLLPDYYIIDQGEEYYTLQNYQGKTLQWPVMPD
ncbi:MAG: KamA family radical SAM protein [Chloroflexi bacterium]|nr:KamA family radical SAM protein [Chloroflexota bacterium]